MQEYVYILDYRIYEISNPENYKDEVIYFIKEVTDDFSAASYAFDYMKTFPRNYFRAKVIKKIYDDTYSIILNSFSDKMRKEEKHV